MTDKSSLAEFDTEVLLKEIVRRNREEAALPVEHWCDQCAHFRFTPIRGAERDTKNNCQMGHAMKFRVPEDFADEYGFYRRFCADRTARPVAPCPTPPAMPRAPFGSRPRLATAFLRKESP